MSDELQLPPDSRDSKKRKIYRKEAILIYDSLKGASLF